MKAKTDALDRAYKRGYLDAGSQVADALFQAFTVAMDGRGLCTATVKAVIRKVDLLFDELRDDNLDIAAIREEAENILGDDAPWLHK